VGKKEMLPVAFTSHLFGVSFFLNSILKSLWTQGCSSSHHSAVTGCQCACKVVGKLQLTNVALTDFSISSHAHQTAHFCKAHALGVTDAPSKTALVQFKGQIDSFGPNSPIAAIWAHAS